MKKYAFGYGIDHPDASLLYKSGLNPATFF
jgi:hypothetical protein